MISQFLQGRWPAAWKVGTDPENRCQPTSPWPRHTKPRHQPLTPWAWKWTSIFNDLDQNFLSSDFFDQANFKSQLFFDWYTYYFVYLFQLLPKLNQPRRLPRSPRPRRLQPRRLVARRRVAPERSDRVWSLNPLINITFEPNDFKLFHLLIFSIYLRLKIISKLNCF